MINKLEIIRTKEEILLELELKGRLDAYSSSLLSQEIEQEIRSGNYDINLNMQHVEYISSAGIRILVKYFKELKSFNGHLIISAISDEARSVLKMVGLDDLLRKGVEEQKKESVDEKVFSKDGMIFSRTTLQKNSKLNGFFYGNPAIIHNTHFTNDDLIKEKFHSGKYGIGFGAFGNSFDDCKYRFGEFIGIGDSVAYLPSDGSNIPDYSLKTGKLIPEINILHGIIFEGQFSDYFQFKPGTGTRSIGFSNLISDISSFNSCKAKAYVVIAETSGLVGTYFIKSPLSLQQDNSLFRFPEIRDHIRFTTEPEYINMLTVTVGVTVKEPHEDFQRLLRPLSEKSDIWGHFHTAVFSFHPIGKKVSDINETIFNLFGTEKVYQVLHLINDSRSVNGVGESEFIHGRCWVGELDIEVKNQTGGII